MKKSKLAAFLSIILPLCLLTSCTPQLLDMDEIIGGSITEQVVEDFPEFTYVAGFSQVTANSFYVIGTKTDHSYNYQYDTYPGPWEIWLSEDGGLTWNQEEYAWQDTTEYISSAAFLPGGGGYFITSMEHETKAENEFIVAYADQQGIDLHPDIITDFSSQIFAKESHSIITVSANNMFHYNLESNHQKTYQENNILTNGKVVVQDDILAACTHNRIALYDLSEGVKLEDIPLAITLSVTTNSIMGDFYNHVFAADDSGYYVCGADGFFRISPDGNMTEQIADTTSYIWNDDTTRLLNLYACGDGSFLLLTSRSGEYGLIRYNYDPTAVRIPETEITIFTLYDSPTLREYIRLYKIQEPAIQLNYHVGVTGADKVNTDNALNTLGMELEAGYGPDILLMDGLPIEQYAESGLLLELSGLPDGEMAKPLLPVVSNAYRTEDGIYAVPTRITVPVIIGEDAAALEDLQALASGFEAASRNSLRLSPALISQWLYAVSGDHDAEFYGMLERFVVTQETAGGITAADSMEPAFALYWGAGETPYALLLLDDMEDVAYLYTATGLRDGDVSVFPSTAGHYLPHSALGINAASQEKDVALEFVRFCLSAKGQASCNLSGIPVNTEAIDEIWSSHDAGTLILESVVVIDGVHYEFDILWPQGEEREHFAELLQNLTQTGQHY